MKRFFLIVALAMLASLCVNPLSTDAALVDGIHTINYQVNKPDSSSASMANDYFAKPAKLIVENGTMKVQITIKNSAWVTELNPPGGLTVISTNAEADQRVVQFSINNFKPLRVGMTIDINDIDYHHSYGTDFVFFENSIQLVEAAPKPEQNTQPNTGIGSQSSNSQGGDSVNNTQNNASQGNSSSNSNSQGVTSNNSSTGANSSANNSNISEQSSDNEDADESTDASAQDEQTAEEQEQNPDTSDSFPVIYVLLLLAAIIVLVINKKYTKKLL